MTDRSNYQQVGVDVDEQSFNALTQRANDAANSMNRLTQVNQSIADSADDVGDRLKAAFGSLSSQVDDNIQSVQDLRKQLTGAADDANKLGSSEGGGGLGNVSGLRTVGRALDQVGLSSIGRPIQQIGDVGIITRELGGLTDGLKGITEAGGPATDIVKAIGGEFGVLAVSGGLVVAALGAITVAGLAFKAELDDASKGLGAAVTYVDDYYKAIEKGTTDAINSQIKALEVQKTIDEEKQKTLQASYNAAHPAPQLTNGQDVDVGAALTSVFSDLSGGGKQLNKDLEDTKKAVSDDSTELQALKAALGDAQVATNDAAEAEKKLQAARDANADKQIQIAQQTAQLEATGTTKQLKDRLAQIDAERDAIDKQIKAGGLSAAETDKLNQRLRDLAAEAERDTIVIGPLIAAREKEAQAEKDALKAAQDKLKQDEKQQQAEVAAVDKYNNAIQSAEDQAAQSRVQASQKLQDALVAAAEKAVDDANKALDQLEQKRASNLTSLDRDLSKEDRAAADQRYGDQIKEQRQEASDLQTHLDNLKQIRDRDAGRQRDDLLNRNFRDLFALNEQKTQDINTENDRYSKQEAQRQEAFNQEESDQLRAQQISRRERLISYQQANADALAQYNLELQTAQQAKAKAIQLAQQSYQRELQLINTTEIQKETIARQAAINEISLAKQTADAIQAIFLDKLQQADQLLGVQQTQSTYTSAGQTKAVPFADGGYATTGQLTQVNDKKRGQRESFNGVPFPPGLGLFIPARSGYIDSGSKSSGPITLSPVYQITGVDAKQVVDIADQRNRKLMKDIGLL